MKKIQLNATTFKSARNTMSAYFGAKFELAVELDKTRKATKALADVIRTDEQELMAVALGTADGIHRTREAIEESLRTNKATYNAKIAPYNALVEKQADALTAGLKLFADGDLYKAYSAYVTDPTDDNYSAYVQAYVTRLQALGLADANVDNVTHLMPNADRELRGTTAVKRGDIQAALNPSAFAGACLRKFYVNHKDAFSSKKFLEYVRKCAEQAKSNK